MSKIFHNHTQAEIERETRLFIRSGGLVTKFFSPEPRPNIMVSPRFEHHVTNMRGAQ